MEKSFSKKNNSIQALKGLLFLWIFFGHACFELSVSQLFSFLSVSVTPFFVISGFFLALRDSGEEASCSIKDCFLSMKKRISRLYPLHIATTLFIVLVHAARHIHGGVLMENLNEFFPELFFHIFLLQSWIPSYDIILSLNAPSWYLSTAAFLYFMFPAIRKALCKANKRDRFVIFIFLLLFRIIWAWAALSIETKSSLEYFSEWACYMCPLFRLSDFFIACLAGVFYKECKGKLALSNLSSAFLQIVTAAFGIFFFNINPATFPFWTRAFIRSDIIRLLLSVIWVYYFIEGKGLVRLFSIAPLVALGNVSGFAYLIHWPVVEIQRAARAFFDIDYSKWSLPQFYTLICVELVITIILSYLWLWFSKKIQARKKPVLEKSS